MTEYYTDPITPADALQRAIATHEAMQDEVSNHAKRHDLEKEAKRDELRKEQRITQEQAYANLAGQAINNGL